MNTPVLLVGLIFSSIGIGYFIYGRKQKHKPAFYCGIGLMVLPYLVPGLISMIVSGLVLMLIPKYFRLLY